MPDDPKITTDVNCSITYIRTCEHLYCICNVLLYIFTRIRDKTIIANVHLYCKQLVFQPKHVHCYSNLSKSMSPKSIKGIRSDVYLPNCIEKN